MISTELEQLKNASFTYSKKYLNVIPQQDIIEKIYDTIRISYNQKAKLNEKDVAVICSILANYYIKWNTLPSDIQKQLGAAILSNQLIKDSKNIEMTCSSLAKMGYKFLNVDNNNKVFLSINDKFSEIINLFANNNIEVRYLINLLNILKYSGLLLTQLNPTQYKNLRHIIIKAMQGCDNDGIFSIIDFLQALEFTWQDNASNSLYDIKIYLNAMLIRSIAIIVQDNSNFFKVLTGLATVNANFNELPEIIQNEISNFISICNASNDDFSFYLRSLKKLGFNYMQYSILQREAFSAIFVGYIARPSLTPITISSILNNLSYIKFFIDFDKKITDAIVSTLRNMSNKIEYDNIFYFVFSLSRMNFHLNDLDGNTRGIFHTFICHIEYHDSYQTSNIIYSLGKLGVKWQDLSAESHDKLQEFIIQDNKRYRDKEYAFKLIVGLSNMELKYDYLSDEIGNTILHYINGVKLADVYQAKNFLQACVELDVNWNLIDYKVQTLLLDLCHQQFYICCFIKKAIKTIDSNIQVAFENDLNLTRNKLYECLCKQEPYTKQKMVDVLNALSNLGNAWRFMNNQEEIYGDNIHIINVLYVLYKFTFSGEVHDFTTRLNQDVRNSLLSLIETKINDFNDQEYHYINFYLCALGYWTNENLQPNTLIFNPYPINVRLVNIGIIQNVPSNTRPVYFLPSLTQWV